MSFNRRDSIIDVQSRFQQKLADLREVWDEMGLDEEKRQERMETAYGHVAKIMDDMVDEERDFLEAMRSDVRMDESRAVKLTAELQLSHVEAPNSNSLWLLADFWKSRLNELSDLKAHRQAELNRLRSEEHSLVGQMDLDELRLPDRPVATEEDLDRLGGRVAQLRQTLAVRQEKLHKTTAMLKTLVNSAIYQPTQDEENLINDPDENFLFSDANMELIDELSFKLDEKYQDFLANIRHRIADVRGELLMWWDLCKIAEAERFDLTDLTEDDFTEELYDYYKGEIAKLKDFYDLHRPILTKVNEWDDQFHKLVNLEDRQKDPNRFFQMKGGALEQELKELNKAKKRNLQLESELMDMAKDWQQLSIHGCTIVDYVASQKQQYADSKEREKLMKQRAKAAQLQKDLRFGTKPPTPKKRPRAPSPPVPSKFQKLQKAPQPTSYSSTVGGGNVFTRSPPRCNNSSKNQSVADGTQPIIMAPPRPLQESNAGKSRVVPVPQDSILTLSYNDFAGDLKQDLHSTCIRGKTPTFNNHH